MSKINFSPEQEEYIVSQYVDFNRTKADIRREFGVSDSVIDRVLKAHNVTIRNSRPNPKNDKQIPEEHRQAIIDAYLSGKGLIAAGAPYGCGQKVVETILKRAGIHKRTYEESKQKQRMYSLNDNFFKTQSSDMAYILGFIAADGNVAKKENAISIQLHEKDAEILEKIKELTDSSRPLDFYKTSQGRDSVKFQVWSAEWKRDLAVYNIVPNKSLILKPPTFLDEKYYKDYIRGYFDGDGSIWTRKDHLNQCYWDIVGASKEMIVWIREVLANQFGIVNNKILTDHLDTGVIMYKITYVGKAKLQQIYDALYSDRNCLSLKRKREKIETILSNSHETPYSRESE